MNKDLGERVALACRILAASGHNHMRLGHVSARVAESDEVIIKAADVSLDHVTADDVVDAVSGGPDARPLHGETPLHTEIYRARPDVGAVVHSHAMPAVAISASTGGFRFVCQDSVHFSSGVAWHHDPRLITSPADGVRTAASLGGCRAMLLKNHGFVVVGESVEEATFLAISFVNSARVQLMANGLGGVLDMTADELTDVAAYASANYRRMVTSNWSTFVERLRSGSTEGW